MFPEKLRPLRTMILLAMIAASGCGSDSDRVAQVALEASQRQAALDQEMARLNREVTEGTRQLIQSRGEADRQILAQQQDLQQQRQQLDDERRDDRQPAAARIVTGSDFHEPGLAGSG